jgi:phage terminase large subunit-like protein
MSSQPAAAPDLQTFSEFCEEVLTLEDGTAFQLYAEQRQMLDDYFSGATETLILVSKKNGKTSLLAALSIWHLIATNDAECVVAAASRDQASVLLRQARGFIRRSPWLQDRMTVKQREINSLRDDGRIRILAADADTADGVLPTLALVDELHRHKSADLYGVFRDGLGPRGGQLITISTAGDYEDSPLGRMRAAAYRLNVSRDGAYRYSHSDDRSFVMHEWALDADEDREDMAVVKKANPAPWQTEQALARRRNSPSMTEWQWARFACGVWVKGEDAAISPIDWQACADDGLTIPNGSDVYLGIDLGWKWDTTAIVPLFVRDGEYLIGKPWVIVPPRDGTSTREEDIIDPIRLAADRWNIKAVVMDPEAGGEQMAQKLERDLGLAVATHSQKSGPMALAAQRTLSAIRGRTLRHPGDTTLTNHVLAAEAKTVYGELWKFVKPRKGGQVIDACVAMAMALSVAIGEASKPAPTAAYIY